MNNCLKARGDCIVCDAKSMCYPDKKELDYHPQIVSELKQLRDEITDICVNANKNTPCTGCAFEIKKEVKKHNRIVAIKTGCRLQNIMAKHISNYEKDTNYE